MKKKSKKPRTKKPKKPNKNPRKKPGKVVEADPVCAVRTTQLNEQRPMVPRPSAFL
jgi:hypothetical protein